MSAASHMQDAPQEEDVPDVSALFPEAPPECHRTLDMVLRAGLKASFRLLPQARPRLEEIAQACDCEVDAIAQIALYKGKTSKKPYLVIASGKRTMKERALAAAIGEVLQRSNDEATMQLTGFAPGMIPPLGLTMRLPVLMDANLNRFAQIWCHAGTPNAFIRVSTALLARAISARSIKPDL